jgi:hypothetical protein
MHQDKFVTVCHSDKLVLVHLLVEIINYTKMHGEYKVKFWRLLIKFVDLPQFWSTSDKNCRHLGAYYVRTFI